MNYTIKNISLLLVLSLCCFSAFAKHLVGGTLTYRSIGFNQYELTLELYRDCFSGTDFDDNIKMGIFDGLASGNDSAMMVLIVKRGAIQYVPNTSNNPCVPAPTNICYERVEYITTVALPANSHGYWITWGRCCRNGTIVNINTPEATGMAIAAFIPSSNLATNNTSPKFNKNSPTFVCLNDLFEFDHSATDADGDSLVYMLSTPYTAGDNINNQTPYPPITPFDQISWMPPYNLNNVMAGNPILNIDPFTGKLSVRPSKLGQFVFSVSVIEYRNGVKLSEVKRDIQLNVTNCPINFPPTVSLDANDPQIKGDTLVFYYGEQKCFNLTVKDENGAPLPQDNLLVSFTGDIFTTPTPPATAITPTGQSPLTTQICWTPDCSEPDNIKTVIMRVSDNNSCPSPNVVFDTIYIKLQPGAATPPDLRCVSIEGPNTVRLSWINPSTEKLNGFNGYIIERNDGTGWTTLGNINDATLTTFSDNTAFNAYTQHYCYRISTAKICPNYFVGQPSNEVCTIFVQAVAINQAQIKITWNPLKDVNFSPTYSILADSGTTAEYVIANGIKDTSFIFTGCIFAGHFRVRVIDPISGCESYSNVSNDESVYNLPVTAIRLCIASVDSSNKGVHLKWFREKDDDFKTYRIYRADAGSSAFSLVGEVNVQNDTTYFDQTALVGEKSYCYYVDAVDVCELTASTQTECTILLSADRTGYTVDLSWNQYSGWNPADYSFSLFSVQNDKSQILKGNFTSSDLTYNDSEIVNEVSVYCYKIEATNRTTNECEHTQSNTVCITFSPTLYLPTAFSPNGDGINDIFEVKGSFHLSYEFVIYNRFGNLIFTSNNVQDSWDGNYKGSPAPEGVYTYRIKAVGFDGGVMQRNGTITLIR
jgi:gliding motility-associated-like protein